MGHQVYWTARIISAYSPRGPDKVFKILAQNETDFSPLWEDKKFKLLSRLT